MSDESDTSSSSSDDECPPEISDEFEKSFFKTLSSLKNNDPSIYDKGKKFFDDSVAVIPLKNSKSKKAESTDKPLFLKDFERKCLTENEGYDDEDERTPPENDGLPYVEEQRKLKESFKSFLVDSEDEEDESLLKPSVKTKEDVEKEEADYILWLKGQKEDLEDKSTEENLKNLRDYWNSDGLDENEAFLRDYILNKRFLDKDDSEGGEDDDDNLTEDSETLEAQETYEQQYNFRFETGDDLIRRFPRNIENSLRRKDNKRSKKRAEIKERKQLEKKKKREEINRQKKLKVKEISEHLEKLKELTGNEKLAFNVKDILDDFDPNEHDKKMSEFYNDEFYNEEDGEKPRIDDIDLAGDYVDNMPEEDMNCFNEEEEDKAPKKGKKTRTKRKKERKKKAFSDISQIEKPLYDPELHESYQKYMDEYYQLDCEDFIEDLPCRFKYKEVEPNDFGLTVEEILAADDKELNTWSSIKKIYKIRPSHVERNEMKMYRRKAENEDLKRKILPSLYKIEEELDFEDGPKENSEDKRKTKNVKLSNKVNVGENNEHDPTDNGLETNLNKNKKRKRFSESGTISAKDSEPKTELLIESQPDEAGISSESIRSNLSSSDRVKHVQTNSSKPSNDKKHFNNSKNKFYKKDGKFKRRHDFHDSRLAAYGINPKKFKLKSS